MTAVMIISLLFRRTRRFFPSDGRNHRQWSFCLPMEGWRGWVGLVGLVEYEDDPPTNGHPSQY